jgi:DNA-binding Lrp family transcriptional regulator
VIAAYILIQTETGKAAVVAAALRDLPGVWETASLAGPYDVIARAQAPDIDELAKPVTSRVQALDGVSRTMTCPVVHL